MPIETEKNTLDLNQPDSQGYTPLYYVAREGSIEKLDLFSESGLDLNQAVDAAGNTMLHIAAFHNHRDFILHLTLLGANVYQPNKRGHTPLYYAARTGSIQATCVLYEAGVNLNQPVDNDGNTIAHIASAAGHAQYIQAIVELNHTTERYIQSLANSVTQDGTIVKHIAAVAAYSYNLQQLHQRNTCNFNLPNKHNFTPGYYAVQEWSMQTMKVLHHAGVDLKPYINHPDNMMFHYAVRNQQDPIQYATHIQLLRKMGADFNQLDKNGFAPTYYLAKAGQIKTITILLQAGLDLNSKVDKDGNTFIHIAIQFRNLEFLQWLIQHQCHISQPNNNGFTPLYYLAKDGLMPFIEPFLSTQFNVNEKVDSNENTSAHIAAQFGHINYLKRLIELGANLEILNKNHRSCIIQAVIYNQLDILVTLHTLGIEFKQNPLSIIIVAAQYNRMKIIRFLHSNGFKLDDLISEATPLAIAALHGHIDTIRLLHELGANFNTEIAKMTEVHAVAITGRLSTLKVLDELGSRLNRPQAQGFTAAHLSALTNEIEIFQYLIEKSDYIPVSTIINFNNLKAALVSCISMRKSQQVASKGNSTFNLDRVIAFWRGKGVSLSENIPLYPHDMAFLIGHDAIDAAFKAKFPHFNYLPSLPPPFPVGNYSMFREQRNRIASSEPENEHSLEESAPSKRHKKGG